MKERPILFSAPMVRAILEDRKTHTRRILKNPPGYPGTSKFVFENHPYSPSAFGGTPADGLKVAPEKKVWVYEDWCGNIVGVFGDCPYGQARDQLWVKETGWYDARDPQNCVIYDSTPIWHKYKDRGVIERSDNECTIDYLEGHQFWHRRPSTFMARWMSRIQLEITNIRAERLKEISADDAEKEGMGFGTNDEGGPVARYQKLWDSINGQGSWAENPWVWIIEFKRL